MAEPINPPLDTASPGTASTGLRSARAGDVMPPAPVGLFASDNAAGAHPAAIDAIVAANEGPALAYGADAWTDSAVARIRELFDSDAEVLFTYGGTGANVVALGSIAHAHEAVICPATAHIHVDECGAPERISGVKLFPVNTEDGKLRPADIDKFTPYLGDPHHPQPRVVAVSQATEEGTIYSIDQIAALGERAHASDLLLFMDGSRLTNAAAALGADVAEFTTRAGVDVVVMGGTKAGLVYGEALVFLRPELAQRAEFVRKASAQLASKQRFIAAQFDAMISSGQWHRAGEHANEMAISLWEQLAAIGGVDPGPRPQSNAIFAKVPTDSIDVLTAWSPFWVWDPGPSGSPRQTVRWMTSWATTGHDIDAFIAGLRHVLG